MCGHFQDDYEVTADAKRRSRGESIIRRFLSAEVRPRLQLLTAPLCRRGGRGLTLFVFTGAVVGVCAGGGGGACTAMPGQPGAQPL